MKKAFFLIIGLILHVFCFSQDLTEEAHIKRIGNGKYQLPNKLKREYELVLNNGALLHVKYNTVQDGENNSSYTFFFFPDELSIEKTQDYNLKIFQSNIEFMLQTLGIDKKYSSDFILVLKKESSKDPNSILISCDFLKGYDECYLQLINTGKYLSFNFFFRRLF